MIFLELYFWSEFFVMTILVRDFFSGYNSSLAQTLSYRERVWQSVLGIGWRINNLLNVIAKTSGLSRVVAILDC